MTKTILLVTILLTTFISCTNHKGEKYIGSWREVMVGADTVVITRNDKSFLVTFIGTRGHLFVGEQFPATYSEETSLMTMFGYGQQMQIPISEGQNWLTVQNRHYEKLNIK